MKTHYAIPMRPSSHKYLHFNLMNVIIIIIIITEQYIGVFHCDIVNVNIVTKVFVNVISFINVVIRFTIYEEYYVGPPHGINT